jgi:hypothetical protein
MEKKKGGLTRAVLSSLAGGALAVLATGCITITKDNTGYQGVVPIWQHKEYQPPSRNLPDYRKGSNQEVHPAYQPPVHRF